MLLHQYAEHITAALNAIEKQEKDKILQAAQIVRRVLAADGLIYVFGCGHSHMLCEETFYRAGGLANVAPILYPPLMLHEGAAESSRLEKQQGLAETVLAGYAPTPRDMLFCLSTSGINAVPVETAQKARAMGLPVVAICSAAYFNQPANTADGKHLHEVCNLWIDNQAPHGDACLHPKNAPVSITPLSTITGIYILNSILAEGIQLALTDGVDVPIYVSGNVPGGAQRNQALIRRFQPRIRHL